MRLPVLPCSGLVLCLSLCWGLPAGAATQQTAPASCPAPKAMRFVVDGRFQRDVEGFTEGFEIHDHQIYESTGSLFGGSRLLRMTLKGHVTVMGDDGQAFFGEGLTILDGKIYRLTWKDHKVFVYDLAGKRERTMANSHEGWGLTNDGKSLIFDDGGSNLYFADPATFAIRKTVPVRNGAHPINEINELEYVDGQIYANVFETRVLLRIDAATGCVSAETTLDTLWDKMSPAERAYTSLDQNFVANGIAYDHATKIFYLTGKEWPMVFYGHFEN